MTLIINVGDIHVSDRPPVNCTDSYTDDIIDILKWTANLQQVLEADATVWAGDVFDHKAPSKNSHALVLKMIEVVKAHEGKLWIVPGNHDVSNDRLESIHEKQPLGVLYASGAHELNGWHPTLPVYGVPWQQDWERSLERAFAWWRKDPWRFEKDPSRLNRSKCLAVTHASIFPPVMADGIPYEHLPAEDVAKAMGNDGYLHYGHIHDYHGVFEVAGATFANVGAISRGSLTESHLSRAVKILVWSDQETYGSNDLLGDYEFHVGFNEITVPHKPASEVFRVTEGLAKKDERLSLDSFLSQVGSSTLDISSTSSIIGHVRTMDAPAPVKQRAIALLEEVDS